MFFMDECRGKRRMTKKLVRRRLDTRRRWAHLMATGAAVDAGHAGLVETVYGPGLNATKNSFAHFTPSGEWNGQPIVISQGTTMINLSNLIVSTSDLQQLEALLDTLPRERATEPKAYSKNWSAPRSGLWLRCGSM
jgi:hypothetical protein